MSPCWDIHGFKKHCIRNEVTTTPPEIAQNCGLVKSFVLSKFNQGWECSPLKVPSTVS